MRRSSGEVPLLGVPSLAVASAEATDGCTLWFLHKKNLALKKEENQERRKVEEKEQLKAVKEEEAEDPDGWLKAFDSDGDLYYWHRRTSEGQVIPSSQRLWQEEEEEEEEEATSSYFLSSWRPAPGCLRQGYRYSLLVIVMLARRLRQASSPGLRGSSGGDSLLCVRDCPQLERLHWWCHVRQAPR